MSSGQQAETNSLISIIYETAEEIELWPQQEFKGEFKLVNESKGSDKFPPGAPLIQLKTTRGSEETDVSILLDHLQRAHRFNQRVEQIKENLNSAKDILDHIPLALISVDKKLKVQDKNKLATRLVESHSALHIKNQHLACSNRITQERLKTLVSQACSNRHPNKKPHALKLEIKESDLILFAVNIGDESSSICTLFIKNRRWGEKLSSDNLKAMFGLTAAEARLTFELATGQSLGEISEKFSLSQNTVRNHLKAVFSKTGTCRQAELVALVLSSPISNTEKHNHIDKKRLPKKENRNCSHGLRLADGRQLKYLQLGEPSGTPVIYFHDSITWKWWELIEENFFEKRNINFIHPFRPGYQGTDLFNRGVDLKIWANDISKLLQHCKVDEHYTLGFSNGSIFAAASANQQKERCIKASLVSCMGPISEIGELDGLNPMMSRLLLGFARLAPNLYKKFFASVLHAMRKNSLEYLRQYCLKWSPYDQNIINNEKSIHSIHSSLQDTLSTSSSGLLNECLVAVKDWGFDLSSFMVPTDIWRGIEDFAVSAILVDKLRAIPNHNFRQIAESGHFLVAEQADNILQSLLSPSSGVKFGKCAAI